MFIGDGYDDLITGFEKAIEIGADVFVLEGGPYNAAKNPVEAFAKAVAASRILCPGKVVGTNGAYERECRVGLRSGLNVIITGFPKIIMDICVVMSLELQEEVNLVFQE